MVGIENLKKVFKGLINFGETLELKASDGKLTWMEALSSAVSLVPEIIDAVRNGGVIYEELQDLDDEERTELVLYIEGELDLTSDRTEEQIEAGAELVAALDKFRSTFKKEEEV